MVKPMLPQPLHAVDETHVRHQGRDLVYFGGCDYFRLSWHPTVREALTEALDRWGLTVAASRRTTGNHPLYRALEVDLTRYFGAEDALLTSNGYMAPLAVAQGWTGRFSHVLLDARAHACLRDAATLFQAPVLEFAHRDPEDVERLCRLMGRKARPLLLTDGLFAHDGSLAPLQAYREVLPRRAWMLVDDAHAAGLVGRRGRGTWEWAGLDRRCLIQTITLSKAWGAYGGAVLGPAQLIRDIWKRSHQASGNTPLPLPLAAAAQASTHLLALHPEWRQKLQDASVHLAQSLGRKVADTCDWCSPILGWEPKGDPKPIMRKLRQAGMFPSHIHYPGGPARGYFRFALSIRHTPEQITALAEVLRPYLAKRSR